MYRIVYTKQAVKDIKNLKSVHLGNLQGVYSRRINIQHRLVYQVYNEPIIAGEIEYNGTIKIIRMWTHYDKVR